MRDVYLKAKEILGKKPVEKGGIIMISEPFAYVIDYHLRGSHCDNCLMSSEVKMLKPCKTCGFVWYCSEQCEIAGNDIHKFECLPFKRLKPYELPSFARLLLRIIHRLKNGGDRFAEPYAETKTRKFKDLMNHYSDIRKDDKRMKDIQNIRKILGTIMGEKNLPPESVFIGLYGRALVNRFCLMDSQMSPIGSAVYVAASIFDHSCVPNAYASFKGKKVVIRSLVDWPELDLTKVFISYVDVLNGTSQRRSELWQNWYFWCQCQLCNDQERIKYENAYKCDNPDCQLPVPVPEKPTSLFCDEPEPEPECGFCGTIVDEDALEEYHSAVAYTRQRLRTLKETDPSLEVCLSVIEKQKDLFSSMNLWRVKALDNIFNATYYNGMFSPALQWGYANLEGMKIYYGVNNPTLGMFLMKLGKVMMYQTDYKGGLSIVEEAERILSVALGPEHRLVAEDIRRLKVMALQDPSIYLEMRVLEKEKKEHEMVCKHCGKKKNQPQKAENDKEDLDKPKKVVEKSKKAVEIPVQKEQKVQNKPVNGILRRTILDISLILKTVDTIEPPKSDDTRSSDSSDDSDSETEVSYDHYALINGEIKKVPREMTATIYRSKFNTGNKKIYMANAAVNKPNGKMNGVKDDNKKVKEINGVINGINDKMTSDHDEMKKRIEDFKKLNNQLKELNSKIEIFDGEIGVDKSKTKQVNGETKNYKVEMKENGAETKEINKELKKDGGETKEISKGMKTDIEDIKEINKEMNEAKHEVNGAKPKRRFAFDYPPENRVIVRY